MELAGKVVVVTGASMGIGEAIAKVFAQQEANVVLLSRDAGRAEAARSDEQHLCRFQLELPLHPDFRHDEVPAVAQDLVF